jgi:sterol desaturase/sphingolipid hydroxylase (fatty acid hydroxylase superfamily)
MIDAAHALLTAAFVAAKDALGDRGVYVAMMLLANTGPFLLLNLWSDFFLRESDQGFFGRFRILPGKKADPALTARAKKEALIDHLVSTPIMLWLAAWHLDVWIAPDVVSDELPSFATMLWQIGVCIAIEDTLMYWMHRVEHHPRIYASVHKLHHEFHVSTGWAAAFATPWERLTAFTIPVMLGIWVVKAHMVVRSIYIAIVVTDSFVAHAGYDFPFVPFSSALRHNYHHSHNVGTFGLKSGLWDWLMGTDVSFNRWKARHLAERKARWAAMDAAERSASKALPTSGLRGHVMAAAGAAGLLLCDNVARWLLPVTSDEAGGSGNVTSPAH